MMLAKLQTVIAVILKTDQRLNNRQSPARAHKIHLAVDFSDKKFVIFLFFYDKI